MRDNLASFLAFKSLTSAIQCDFKYVVDNEQPVLSQNLTKNMSSPNLIVNGTVPVKGTRETFDCEEPDDDYEVIRG